MFTDGRTDVQTDRQTDGWKPGSSPISPDPFGRGIKISRNSAFFRLIEA